MEKYRGRLPDGLVDEWTTNGWCRYANDVFWFVNPDLYVDVVSQWLPEWAAEDAAVVFARSPFGDLLVSHDGKPGQLNVHYGRYVEIGGRLDVFLGYVLDSGYVDHAMDGELARQAVGKLGALEDDEMFTFEPALALGGAHELGYVQKVKLFPQLSLLAQLFDSISIE